MARTSDLNCRFGMPRHLAGLTELLTNFRRSRVLFACPRPRICWRYCPFTYIFTLMRFSARASSVQRFSSVYKNSNTILKRCSKPLPRSLLRHRCRRRRRQWRKRNGALSSCSDNECEWDNHMHFLPVLSWLCSCALALLARLRVFVCVCEQEAELRVQLGLFVSVVLLLLAASIWTLCLSPMSSTIKQKKSQNWFSCSYSQHVHVPQPETVCVCVCEPLGGRKNNLIKQFKQSTAIKTA